MRPVSVEVVAYTPTEFFHCMHCEVVWHEGGIGQKIHAEQRESALPPDRKSTRLNSSHRCISYAVFCLKKKKINFMIPPPTPASTSTAATLMAAQFASKTTRHLLASLIAAPMISVSTPTISTSHTSNTF